MAGSREHYQANATCRLLPVACLSYLLPATCYLPNSALKIEMTPIGYCVNRHRK
jgi:hypothetical protein